MKSKLLIGLLIVGIVLVSGCITQLGVTDRCSGAEGGTERTLCYQNAVKTTKDPSICETKMPGTPEKNVCYSNLAIYHNGPKYCEKITGTFQREECYYKIAMSTGEISLCENIETESRKEMCLKHVST